MYNLFELAAGKFRVTKCRSGVLFMNQGIKFPQVIPVHNAKLNEVAPAADFQLFTDPSLVVFNAFPLNNEACSYFGSGKAVGYKG